MRNYSGFVLVGLAAIFDAYAAFIVKSRFNAVGSMDFSSLRNFATYVFRVFKSPWMATAIIAYVAAPALSFVALNKLNLSVAYPVLVAIHLLFAFIFGVFFLSEPVTGSKMIGSALVLLSLYFFYRN